MENLLNKAKKMVELKEYDEALSMLIPKFEEREKDGELYFLIGKCFLHTHDSSNAVRFLQKAVEMEYQNAEYLLALGEAYEVFGDPINAMDTYLKILALSPESVIASERMLELIKSLDRL